VWTESARASPSPGRRLDDASAVVGDLRIDQLGTERLEAAERPFLVGFDQARIAGHIGGEDRREPPFDASRTNGLHAASPVAYDPTSTSATRVFYNKEHAESPFGHAKKVGQVSRLEKRTVVARAR
jgi:hypothetical protein